MSRLTTSQAVAVHTFNPSIQEEEAGRSLWVLDQPGIHTEIQENQGNTEQPYLKKPNQTNYWKLDTKAYQKDE